MSSENIEVSFEKEPIENLQPTIINRGRRTSVSEDAEEGLIQIRKASLVVPPKPTLKDKLTSFCNSCYNSEYREFLSKDAMGWFKLSAYYAVYYLWLSIFFCTLLFLFWVVRIRGQTLPIYYNTDSVMNYKVVNPGLGFRPQLDPESELIFVDTANPIDNVKSMKYFLADYHQKKEATFKNGHDEEVSFNIDELIQDSPCSDLNNFGFGSNSPCVAVKLNRIIGWLPEVGELKDLPAGVNETVKELESSDEKFIHVNCEGQEGADRDQIQEVEYYSGLSSNKVAGINFKYFPYMNQANYLSPLVFVHFKEVTTNVLINVLCKAYAGNIDNEDKLNKRGMVKFQLYVEDLSNKVTEVEEEETTVLVEE